MPFFKNRSAKQAMKVDVSRVTSPKSAALPATVTKVGHRRDNRSAERKGAWCVCSVYANDILIREAVVLDISDTGLRIRFHSRGSIPDIVTLKASRIGLLKKARVVWQDTYDAGLEFIS